VFRKSKTGFLDPSIDLRWGSGSRLVRRKTEG
jgi:hypothetical protein